MAELQIRDHLLLGGGNNCCGNDFGEFMMGAGLGTRVGRYSYLHISSTHNGVLEGGLSGRCIDV